MTNKIAIERDWAILIAKKETPTKGIVNEEEYNEKIELKLANINATVRRFDMSTSILAPTVC